MTAENSKMSVTRCRDCVFGRKTQGQMLELPLETRIPIGVLITPKIRRECLNIIDTIVLGKDRIVRLAATCVKPKSYTPKE